MRFRCAPFLAVFALAACTAPGTVVEGGAVGEAETGTQGVSTGMPALPGDAMTDAEKASCLAKGGTVERRGMIQAETCVTPYADAGKTCTDGDECEGKCLAYGRVGSPPGEQVEGICERDDRTFGCFGIVEDGKVEAGLCVD
ncbi:hypothetical protein K3172_06280 [Qipengyuania sp. 6B39]|uniref:hypothetical protein n=1 Tax=Qipengyuania proteolytica TaxID=2867239 RepID=UPI001C892EB4|nr:hypothetical protein [Qipengyuania proteolytica]MBX7495462.1 hypothetical protein [Qipengyuania proteolytica]